MSNAVGKGSFLHGISQNIKVVLCVTRQPIMQPLVDLSHRYKGYLVCKDDLQEMRKRETFKLLGGKSFKLVFVI